MDAAQTTAARPELAEQEAVRESPIHQELARAYHEIAQLDELVQVLDKRLTDVQSPERGDYGSPSADGDPMPLSPIARAVREQSDQVLTVSNRLRSILSALQT
jgi:hypothetical protein